MASSIRVPQSISFQSISSGDCSLDEESQPRYSGSFSDIAPPPYQQYATTSQMTPTTPIRSSSITSTCSSSSSSSSSSCSNTPQLKRQAAKTPYSSNSSFSSIESSSYLPTSPLGPIHLADPSSPSKTIQVICKLFPKSALARKIKQVEECQVDLDNSEKVVTREEERKMRKKEEKNAALRRRDQMMADEFGRMGL